METEKKCEYSFGKMEGIFLVSQIVLCIIYLTGSEFPSGISPQSSQSYVYQLDYQNYMQNNYGIFQNIHLLLFVGLGLAMTAMRLHSWTSMTFNFLISCWVIQLNIPVNSFVKQLMQGDSLQKVQVDLLALINSDICAAAVVISYGAVLGRANWLQLWLVALVEVFFFSLHEALFKHWLRVSDQGGSLILHGFAGCFGLGLTYFFSPSTINNNSNNISSYNSKLLSLVGTVFVFMYWPSVNAAGATGDAQHLVLVNSVLAMASSVVSTCCTSRLLHGRLDMTSVLNATLAGGAAIGTSANIINNPGIAIVLGTLSGILSTLCFIKLAPLLKRSINLQDQSGVLNLQVIPSVLGGVVGAFVFLDLDNIFGTTNSKIFMQRIGASHRTVQQQCGYQLLAVLLTIFLGIFGGVVAGVICSASFAKPLDKQYMFTDEYHIHDAEKQSLFNKYKLAMNINDTPNKKQQIYIELNTESNVKQTLQTEENQNNQLMQQKQQEYNQQLELEQKKLEQMQLDLQIIQEKNTFELNQKERITLEIRNEELKQKNQADALELEKQKLLFQQQQLQLQNQQQPLQVQPLISTDSMAQIPEEQ